MRQEDYVSHNRFKDEIKGHQILSNGYDKGRYETIRL